MVLTSSHSSRPTAQHQLDQSWYGISIVECYLPNAASIPTPEDMQKYASPLLTTFKWTADDNSTTKEEVRALESEYGIRLIEVAGSLNYLANTDFRLLFAIQKLCRYTTKPGCPHFQATMHMLNHLRCLPAKTVTFYHDSSTAPIAKALSDAGKGIINPSLIWFTDSSFSNCNKQHSTGCHVGMFQGVSSTRLHSCLTRSHFQ
jgi:hypothetical protein